MLYGDHAPPHFHAVYQGEEIQININTLEVIEGDMSRRAQALVLEWAALHRIELRQAWEAASQNQAPSKIPPLEQNRIMIRIISAEPLSDYRLKITFNDGVSGIFPVEPARRGGVFLALLNAKVFNAVTINSDFGCVEWPGGIDLCPDTMHQVLTGSEPEMEPHSEMTLREAAKENTKPR
jgi:hypothetical protein